MKNENTSKPDVNVKSKILAISLVSLTSIILILLVVLLVSVLSESKKPTSVSPDDVAAFLPTDSEATPTPDGTEKAETPKEEPPVNEPAPQKSLLFTSNGDGTCRLSGLGTSTDACVIIPERSPAGDLVTEIDAEAFLGKSGISAIQIPSTVQKIGERAFADCRDLLTISVSRESRAFCDVEGTLYTKDQTVLLQYPPLRAAGSVKLPRSLVKISEMAFYNCPYLTKVIYAGNAADWEAIAIGAKNYALTAAAKQFGEAQSGK